MRILDRYITKSIISVFLTCILIFSVLYILIDIASNLDDLIDRKVPVSIIIEYYLSFFPVMITQTAPIATLIASLFTYSHLNSTNELIALRTSGLNFWNISKPAIFTALIVATLIFLINEKLVPRAQETTNRIKNENMILEVDKDKKKKAKIKNLTFYGLKNRLYFIDSYDPNSFVLEGITIIGFDNTQNIREKVVALKGDWTGIAWNFKQTQISNFNESDFKSPIKIKFYPEKTMDIKETPKDFLRQRLNVESMNIKQLKSYISKFADSGATKAINNLRVDLHQKFAYPVGTIVIVLVGLPLAMITGRRKALTFTSLGIAVAIGFFYYVFNAVGLALGKGGIMPPFYSAWLAPFCFFIIALYMIKTKFD